jgi:hypothetical protein
MTHTDNVNVCDADGSRASGVEYGERLESDLARPRTRLFAGLKAGMTRLVALLGTPAPGADLFWGDWPR